MANTFLELVNLKLHEGMEVPNHRAMCELLDEGYSDQTSAIKKKEKRWRRYFTWRKNGRRYIIEDIYEKARPEDLDKRDEYSQHILVGIAAYLNGTGRERDFFSNHVLLTCCGFVNRNWSNDIRLREYATAHDYSYDEAKYQLCTLENHVGSFCISDHLVPSLKKLTEKGFVDYDKKIVIDTGISTRNATEEEAKLYYETVAEYKEKKGLYYLNRYDWSGINKLVKERMKIPGLEKIRPVHDIAVVWSPFDGMDDNEIENTACESLLTINERSLAYMRNRVEKDVRKSTWNYLMYSYGPNPGTSMIIAPEKTQAIREQDRMDLIAAFIEIGYDDLQLPF